MRSFKSTFSRRPSASGPYPSSTIVIPAASKGSISLSIKAESVGKSTMSYRDSATSLVSSASGHHSTMSRPHPYVKRPNLIQLLADEAQPPWTLDAFTAYAARNLCLENLEFIQDARRYQDEYRRTRSPANGLSSSTQDWERPNLRRSHSAHSELLKEMWTRMILQYIAPSSPKELNIPGDIRAGLVNQNKLAMPPPPEALDPAFVKIYELIEDSILFPFFNEISLSSNASTYQSSNDDGSRFDPETSMSSTSETRDFTSPGLRSPVPLSPPVLTSRVGHHNSLPNMAHRPESLVATLYHSPSESAVRGTSNMSLDRSVSEENDGPLSPMRSPPATPGLYDPESRQSPKLRKDPSWKRVSQRLGFGKKHSSQLRDVAEDQRGGPNE